MNKKEQKLVEAIEGGNYENAQEALAGFVALKGTTDEQANDYFEKVEALLDVEVEAEIEEVEAVIAKPEVKAEEVVVAPREEKRGVKAQAKSREQVLKAFNNALEVAMDYRDSNRRTSEGRFALRLVRQLGFIKKRLLR